MVSRFCKNQKGFTLVEVIVVAVIVAVLAAVAIPLYMGYMRDSRVNVGNNIAGTIASAAGASTQQKSVFTVQAGASVEGTLLVIRLPSVSDPGTAASDNVIIVPANYTVAWTDAQPGTPLGGPATVEVYFTDYGAGSGKVYTYKE